MPRRVRRLAQPPRDLEARQPGHHHVEDGKGGRELRREPHRLASRRSRSPRRSPSARAGIGPGRGCRGRRRRRGRAGCRRSCSLERGIGRASRRLEQTRLASAWLIGPGSSEPERRALRGRRRRARATPPCASAIRRETARPRPVPGDRARDGVATAEEALEQAPALVLRDARPGVVRRRSRSRRRRAARRRRPRLARG